MWKRGVFRIYENCSVYFSFSMDYNNIIIVNVFSFSINLQLWINLYENNLTFCESKNTSKTSAKIRYFQTLILLPWNEIGLWNSQDALVWKNLSQQRKPASECVSITCSWLSVLSIGNIVLEIHTENWLNFSLNKQYEAH